MSDSQMEMRDTSWVQGVLAEHFTHFPGSVRRMVRDGRYYLPEDEGDFRDTLGEISDYLSYRNAKYKAENLHFTIQSASCQQDRLNGIGVLIDYATGDMYNFIVFDDGTIAEYDDTVGTVREESDIFDIEYGIIVL